jgi:hypothetical protein
MATRLGTGPLPALRALFHSILFWMTASFRRAWSVGRGWCSVCFAWCRDGVRESGAAVVVSLGPKVQLFP